MDERIMVNMGEGAVARAPAMMAVVGVGSCVVLMLYDPGKRVGGLAHILLPQSPRLTEAERTGAGIRIKPEESRGMNSASAKTICLYADTALTALLREMTGPEFSSDRAHIFARIAGGARMFSDSDQSGNGMGARNIAGVKDLLQKEKIPLIAEEIGGSRGRSVDFDLVSGRILIRTVRGMEKEI